MCACVLRRVQAKVCGATTPHALLDDVFDMSVLSICEDVFTFVESRIDAWSNDPFSVRLVRFMLTRSRMHVESGAIPDDHCIDMHPTSPFP